MAAVEKAPACSDGINDAGRSWATIQMKSTAVDVLLRLLVNFDRTLSYLQLDWRSLQFVSNFS